MFRATILAVIATACFAIAGSDCPAQDDSVGDATPQQLFDQRIMPIFRSEQPSSCVQCHLAAVDLKNYILPSLEQTFVSLRDQGLIDMEKRPSCRLISDSDV